jgi:hypothetical protein
VITGQTDFLLRFTQSGMYRRKIFRFDSPTGKTDLTRVVSQVSRPLRKQYRFTTIAQHNREKHSSGRKRQIFATLFLNKMPFEGLSQQAATNFF